MFKTFIRDIAAAALRNEVTVIFTPYKVGSTTLFDRLVHAKLCAGGHFSPSMGLPPRIPSFIVKAHSGDTDLRFIEEVIQRPVDRIITLVRKQSEIYLSALFQNITSDMYGYRYGSVEEVLSASPEQLLRHFLEIDWPQFPHLQIQTVADQCLQFCGVDIAQALQEASGDCIASFRGVSSRRPVSVHVAHMDLLSSPTAFKLLLRQANFPFYIRLTADLTKTSNVGSNKWYGAKYLEVKAILEQRHS